MHLTVIKHNRHFRTQRKFTKHKSSWIGCIARFSEQEQNINYIIILKWIECSVAQWTKKNINFVLNGRLGYLWLPKCVDISDWLHWPVNSHFSKKSVLKLRTKKFWVLQLRFVILSKTWSLKFLALHKPFKKQMVKLGYFATPFLQRFWTSHEGVWTNLLRGCTLCSFIPWIIAETLRRIFF